VLLAGVLQHHDYQACPRAVWHPPLLVHAVVRHSLGTPTTYDMVEYDRLSDIPQEYEERE